MARATRMLVLLLASVVGAAGCDDDGDTGLGEPIRIREGVFHRGELPTTGLYPGPDGGAVPPGPQITAFENANSVVRWLQAGKAITGRATPEAWSVAVRIAGLGSGYWVVPVGAIDPTANGERVWSVTADFASGLPTGARRLQLVALDGQGAGGPTTEIELCVVSDLPDNLNACDRALAPPAVVVSLTWDSDVDLDLVAESPDGKRVDWRHPTTALPDGGRIGPGDLLASDLGALDRNSNANCAIDSIRREDLIWQEAPRAGTWRIYANLFSACGLPSVSFRATVYRRRGADAGPYELVETERAAGQLTQLAANGGAGLGLRLLEVTLP